MGFLSGLQDLLGPGGGEIDSNAGFLDRLGHSAHNFLSGSTPELSMHQAAPLQDERLGAVQQMPEFAPTGKTTGGLLERMQAPDDRGMTFADKLWTAGSVLGGDNQGADTFRAGRQLAQQGEEDKQRAKALATKGAQAFRDAIGPDGQFNTQGYAAAMGADLDPNEAANLHKALQRNYQLASLANGGAGSFDPASGKVTQQIAGQRPAPDGYTRDPATGALGPIDPNYVAGQRQIYGDRYEQQRLNRTFAPRAPAKPGAPRPQATGGRL